MHPAKLEVRFEEENKVFKAVYHAIKDTLLKGDLVADTENMEEKTKTVPMDTVVVSTKPAEELNYTSEIAKKEEKGFAGGLFHRFTKGEKGETNKPDIKENLEDNNYQNNFIAQIYSNKFENQKPEVITEVEDTKQLDNMETKVIDTKEKDIALN